MTVDYYRLPPWALTVAVIQRVRPRGVGVVYPERDTGKRVAHLISGRLMDYIEFDDGFAMVKMRAPRAIYGRSLSDAALRSKYGVTVSG